MAFDPKKRMAQILRAAKRAAKPPKTQAQKEQYLKYKAKKMDNNPTGCEEIFYNMLIDLKIKFETQKIVHGKIFDFYITEKNTLVEVDGNYWHGYGLKLEEMNDIQKKAFFNDQKKTVLAEGAGFKLIRVWEHELDDEHYEETKNRIRSLLK